MATTKITLNYSVLNSQLREAVANDKTTAILAFEEATNNFNTAKDILINDFEKHPVTRELQGGPESPNLSGTIDGNGNLFSFIGFTAGTDPTDPIRAVLNSLNIYFNPKPTYTGKLKMRFAFRADLPSLKTIEDVTPMPKWTTGSWVRRIERNITGINRYLFYTDTKQQRTFRNSRSTTGIQIKGNTRKSFGPLGYISEIIKTFVPGILQR